MSSEWDRLQQQLERATAREGADPILPPGNPLDEELELLREGWSALSQLCEAADRDQPPLVIRPADWDSPRGVVQGDSVRKSSEVLGRVSRERGEFRYGLPRAALVRAAGWAVAASVLGAAICGWYLLSSRSAGPGPAPNVAEGPVPAPAPSGSPIANQLPQPDVGASGEGGGSQIAEAAAGQVVPELVWDDTWDDQLAEAGLAMSRVRGAASGRDAWLSSLRDSLEQMDQELTGDSL